MTMIAITIVDITTVVMKVNAMAMEVAGVIGVLLRTQALMFAV